MMSINFILGKREREPIPKRTSLHHVAHWEGEGVSRPPISPTGHPTTYYANTKIFSRRTERDDNQPVGELYKGVIEENEEGILRQEEKGLRLVKKMTLSNNREKK